MDDIMGGSAKTAIHLWSIFAAFSMFVVGLVGIKIPLSKVFEYQNIISDIFFFEIAFLFIIVFLMIRNHKLAKLNNRSLVLAQFHPIRLYGFMFTVLISLFVATVLITDKLMNNELNIESILTSKIWVVLLLCLITLSYYKGIAWMKGGDEEIKASPVLECMRT